MKVDIIYQDKYLIVVDKPAGLEVFAGPKNQISLYDLLLSEKLIHPDAGPVHRIDADTSGIVLVAKDIQTFAKLKDLFKNRQIKKEYTALVYGNTPDRGEIKTFIARDPKRKQAMKAIQYPPSNMRGNLKEALTFFEKIKNYQYKKDILSLLKVNIATGRTHQIRVHMQFQGTPIVGDQMYYTKASKQVSKSLNLNRQFLHASLIEFTHPITDEKMKFTSFLPKDLASIIDKIKS